MSATARSTEEILPQITQITQIPLKTFGVLKKNLCSKRVTSCFLGKKCKQNKRAN